MATKQTRTNWEGVISYMSVGRLKMDVFAKRCAGTFRQETLAKLGHTNSTPGRPGHCIWLVVRKGGTFYYIVNRGKATPELFQGKPYVLIRELGKAHLVSRKRERRTELLVPRDLPFACAS